MSDDQPVFKDRSAKLLLVLAIGIPAVLGVVALVLAVAESL